MLDVEDLLIEILIRLPPRSLLRLQCVSKQWLSIISSPNFRRLHSRRSAAVVTGLFFPHHREIGKPAGPSFVALPNEKHQQRVFANRVREACDGRFVVSLNSCNGLLCIGLSDEEFIFSKMEIYVYNPTTNQRTRIPELLIPEIQSRASYVTPIAIAFEPSKSNHYKLVCVCEYYRYWVFSSESRVWRNTCIQVAPKNFNFYTSSSPYLNGGIHWCLHENEFVCFDVDSCVLRPMPCIPCLTNNPVWCKYFGECGGHLHFIAECGRWLKVFEMMNDYSQWIFKYQLDVGYVARFKLIPYEFWIHFFTAGEEEGLVISLDNGKVLFFDLHNMSTTQLESSNGIRKFYLRRYFTSKHIETLAFVEPGI